MRIRVDEIPEAGRFLHFHWVEERLKEFLPPDDPFELELARPVNVDLEVHRRVDHIRVLGTIEGLLRVACHRCLGPVTLDLDEQVDVMLLKEREISEEEETELEEEEMEYEFFDGETIDIDQLVAEQIFLSLPFKVLCKDDCLGLCARCGANLNDEPCECNRGSGESPFSKLAALKDKLPEPGED